MLTRILTPLPFCQHPPAVTARYKRLLSSWTMIEFIILNKLTALKKSYAKVFLWFLVTLFLIPTITLLFTQYGRHQFDQRYSQLFINDARNKNLDITTLTVLLQQHPPSSVCGTVPQEWLGYQHVVCAPRSELWQFTMMGHVARWTLLGSGVVLLMVLLFAALAFRSRQGQLISLTPARQFLMLASALEVLVQGGMLVWLSFWCTALFTYTYSLKLVVAVGLLVLAGIYYMLKGIFKKVPGAQGIEGEVVKRAAAPALWARIDALARDVGTTPPDHIIAGIDTHFYVTEAPLDVNGQILHGRKLYVSIPLLRQLTTSQADGVMVHELTHLYEGDAASGALLGPKLHQFDEYTRLMSKTLATLVVYYPLYLYRALFELAWRRNSRQREFIADRSAAMLINPAAIVQSLIKISAYASYRNEVEAGLFDNKTLHKNALGIREAIAAGLPTHVRSPDFLDTIRARSVPHPFDSHPPLADRIRNVGYRIDEVDYAGMATELPAESWVDLMPVAAEIEQKLWHQYERNFSSVHEESLAWRYQPEGEEETALVLKYFPSVTYTLKGGHRIEITYQGIILPKNSERLEWNNIRHMNVLRRFGTYFLTLHHIQPNYRGKKRSDIPLPGLGKEIKNVKSKLSAYWRRHQTARALYELEQHDRSPQ